jgi:antitoxin YefM
MGSTLRAMPPKVHVAPATAVPATNGPPRATGYSPADRPHTSACRQHVEGIDINCAVSTVGAAREPRILSPFRSDNFNETDRRAGGFSALLKGMRILPIADFEKKITEYVDEVSETRGQITITKNDSPAAVLVGIDEWESIQETLHWLAQPDITKSVAESEADIAADRTYGEDDIRTAYNAPRPL